MERPSGVSSGRDANCAASASIASLMPESGAKSVAWRLPSVIVPVLSRNSVWASPAASTARPDIASVVLHQTVHTGDADRRQQAANGRRDETDQQRDQHEDRLRRTRVDRERLQRDDGDQEDDRQPRQQDVQRDLVRRLLSFGALDERNHAVEKVSPGLAVTWAGSSRTCSGAAGHCRTIAARFADDRRRFTSNRALVHRRDAFDDVAVGRNDLAGRYAYVSPFRRDGAGTISSKPSASSRFAVVSVLARRGVSACALPRPSAIASAKLAKSTVSHNHSVICVEADRAGASSNMLNKLQRREHAADLPVHHGIARQDARVELAERICQLPAGRARNPG